MSRAAVWWLGIWIGVCVWAAPPHHRGWLRLWEEGESCGECDRSRCPVAPPDCPAGLVRDRCSCCEHCGNAEGQWCDLNSSQEFYGRCGEGLRCQRRPSQARAQWGEPEPRCVCESQGAVCGSDGQTYLNLCQLREAANQLETTLNPTAQGPCSSAPRITRAPSNTENYTGHDIVFGCEVTAYPLPHVSWKKKGSDAPCLGMTLASQYRHVVGRSATLCPPGSRSTASEIWMPGVYVCISHNTLGEASATAHLSVLTNAVGGADGGLHDGFYYDRENKLREEELESGRLYGLSVL